jgi:hypothetical protein
MSLAINNSPPTINVEDEDKMMAGVDVVEWDCTSACRLPAYSLKSRNEEVPWTGKEEEKPDRDACFVIPKVK